MRPIAKYLDGKLWQDIGGVYQVRNRRELWWQRLLLTQLDPEGHRERINQINQAIAAWDKDHESEAV